MVQLQAGGDRIAEDAVVEGDTKYDVLYEQFAHRLGRKMAALESGIDQLLSEIQGVPENEQIKQLERELDRILADLGNMSREMKQTFEEEVLPLLKKKIEELRRILEKKGEEGELKSIDKKLGRIDEQVRT